MRRIGQNRRLMRMRLAGNIIGQAGGLAGKRARNGYELVTRKERETWHCMPRKADREGKSSAVGETEPELRTSVRKKNRNTARESDAKALAGRIDRAAKKQK